MNLKVLIGQLTERHAVSEDAVRTLWRALERGGGRLAQFSHPELGGYGQRTPGMTQIGDIFNHELRSRVDRLCQELSNHFLTGGEAEPIAHSRTPTTTESTKMKPMSGMKSMSPMEPPKRWWPEALGESPNSVGGQNETRYAFFGDQRRLAVDIGNGKIQLYDTGDHRISGVQQHQSGGVRKVTFTSQYGEVDLANLKAV